MGHQNDSTKNSINVSIDQPSLSTIETVEAIPMISSNGAKDGTRSARETIKSKKQVKDQEAQSIHYDDNDSTLTEHSRRAQEVLSGSDEKKKKKKKKKKSKEKLKLKDRRNTNENDDIDNDEDEDNVNIDGVLFDLDEKSREIEWSRERERSRSGEREPQERKRGREVGTGMSAGSTNRKDEEDEV